MKNKDSRLKIIIILMIVTSFVLGTGITYSILMSSTKIFANQKIAQFVFNAKKTDVIELPLSNIYPGQTEEYNFQVTNAFDNIKSDVTIKYQITTKTFHFMPLEIKLYKVSNEQEELIVNCDESFSRNSNNELVCNTSEQAMDFKDQYTDDYKLVVKFPEEYNSESYSDLVDYIDIEIKSWQEIGD